MHKLLELQLKEILGSPAKVPAHLRPLFRLIGETYARAEAEQAQLSRALELTSQDLAARNEQLKVDSRDIRAAEGALKALELRSQRLLDSTQEMIFGLDRDGRVVFANRSAAQRLGLLPEELTGKSHSLFHHVEHSDARPCAILASLRDGEPRVVDSDTFWTKEGKPLPVEYSVSPQVEDGEPNGVVVVAHDQIERLKLEERLRVSDRLASLGTLAAGVAHEINNPLSYVASNLEFVADRIVNGEEADPETRAEILAALGEAKEGARRISRTVTDLRTFSEPTEETNAPLDPTQVVRTALQLVRHEIRHRARVVEELGPVPKVLASRSKLEQVFIQLLLNAAQAIPEGDASRHAVTVRARTQGRNVVLEVEDSGAGMSREVQQRIFDPFFSTRPIGSATGMGLAVCHGIVTSVGGAIEVHSKTGRGSLFRVLLPACEDTATAENPRGLATLEPTG